MSNNINPIAVANASGYPLEAALAAIAKKWEGVTLWHLLAREHPWDHPVRGDKRFIDIVLGGQKNDEITRALYRSRLVIECKRVEGHWVFPVRQNDAAKSNQVRVLCAQPGTAAGTSWRKVSCGPPSYHSEFCAMSVKKGSAFDGLDRRTIEGWGSELIQSGLALAAQESESLGANASGIELISYIPMIVTTAPLTVLFFDPERVDLSSGHVTSPQTAEPESVGWVRFTKNLGFEPLGTEPLSPRPDHLLARQGVWVVHASAFLVFLKAALSFRVSDGA